MSTAVDISFEARAYQACVLGLKLHWTRDLYTVIAERAQASGAGSAAEIEEALADDPAYQLFGWLEHHLQQYKYLGRWGILPEVEAQADRLEAILDGARQRHPERLHLDPDVVRPAYYEATDFHEHPGGIWSDPIDAFAYEWGANTTTPTLDDHDDLHDRFAALVRDRWAPGRVLDAGCGFAKTTIPLKRALPDAEVVGCDLSEPALVLGHLRAVEAGLPIHLHQQNVEELGFADGSFDAVVSSMLIHELPPPALRRALAEAFRVLAPGGVLAHLDFAAIPGGEVGRFFLFGHSHRNWEPYIRTLMELDLEAELTAVGFEDVTFDPFEEVPGALAEGDELPRAWRFPWTVLSARRPA